MALGDDVLSVGSDCFGESVKNVKNTKNTKNVENAKNVENLKMMPVLTSFFPSFYCVYPLSRDSN